MNRVIFVRTLRENYTKPLALFYGRYYNLVELFNFAGYIIWQEREFGYGERPEMGKVCRAYGALL